MVHQLRNFIEGEWVESKGERELRVLNPATGDDLGLLRPSTALDVDAAVQAAVSSPWRTLPPAGRAGLLRALSQSIFDNLEELAQLETADVGKPITESRNLDVPGAGYCFDYYAGWPSRIYGDTIPHSMMPVLNYTLREPIGVVGAIVPWNFPLSIGAWKVAPALAAGCPVVLKTSEYTPMSFVRLCELADEVGFPPGALNLVLGDRETGDALVRHPDVSKITFTGSTAVGRQVMAAAAPTLKALTLECGGKNPNIIFGDADLDRAVEATLFGIFANQGEVCAAGSRVLLDRAIHDDFMDRLTTRAKQLRVGDPTDEKTHIGALISDAHCARVDGFVRDGIESGATLVTGGERQPVDGFAGNFYPPTIFDDVDNSSRIAQEEIFGPVLTVIPFSGDQEAAQIANDTMYGLVSNVHTNDLRRAHTIAGAIEAGSVFVNLPPIPFAEAPIGAYKQTGVGKDLGKEGLDGYLTTKSVVIDLSAAGEHFRWFAP
jgi:acyl-CoA reductase-like NAD-dependent aldehyde dehydrogenase